MSRNRLYLLAFSLSIAGATWLGWNIHSGQKHSINVCMFKNTTGLACPSCGITRALILLLSGNFSESIQMNPLGLIVIIIIIAIPAWIGFDLAFKKSSFYNCYFKAENLLKKKWIAVPAVGIILLNWMWNICKDL
ncbi:MAG: DUF2752 domain-containing protein [Cytophagaceae bacterium]